MSNCFYNGDTQAETAPTPFLIIFNICNFFFNLLLAWCSIKNIHLYIFCNLNFVFSVLICRSSVFCILELGSGQRLLYRLGSGLVHRISWKMTNYMQFTTCGDTRVHHMQAHVRFSPTSLFRLNVFRLKSSISGISTT